ncbi:cell division protein CrgA [Georgenia phoenicis]|uniref:cell division protein CrgA n=1 Tax=unclassified Georgenia TaxID=2626815 RepID=UPI0039B0619E
MPESKRRKKKATYTPPSAPAQPKESPRWWVPTAVVLMVVGMLWVVVTYIVQAAGPIPGIGNLNLGIGFVVLLVGFLMTLRWR